MMGFANYLKALIGAMLMILITAIFVHFAVQFKLFDSKPSDFYISVIGILSMYSIFNHFENAQKIRNMENILAVMLGKVVHEKDSTDAEG
jgi:uncharacterized membrane protein